jgi:hypothetical protein
MKLPILLTCISALAVGGLTSTHATAAESDSFLYEGDFTGVTGSNPAYWSKLREIDGIFVRNGELILRRDSNESSSDRRTAIYAGPTVDYWEDYVVEVTFSDNRQHQENFNQTYQGIVARVQPPTGDATFGGYFAYRMGNEIAIDRNFRNDEFLTGVVTLATAPLSQALEQDAFYRLQFTLNGSELTAELFDENDVSLGSVSATDTEHTQGPAGVRSLHTFWSSETRYRDFAAAGISSAPANLLLQDSFFGFTNWASMFPADGVFATNGELILRRLDSESNAQRRAVLYTGPTARFWDDYVAEVTFMDNRQHLANYNNTYQGIIARAQTVAPTATLPYRGYYAHRKGDELRISRNYHPWQDLDVADNVTILASAPLSASLLQNQPYRLRFTVEGTNLHAELFDSQGLSLGSVSASDGSYSTGTAGLHSYHSFWSSFTRYSDFKVEGLDHAPANLLLADNFVGATGTRPSRWQSVPAVDVMNFANRTFTMARDEVSNSGIARTLGYIGAGSQQWGDTDAEVWFQHSRQQNTPDTQGLVLRWQGNTPTTPAPGQGYLAHHIGNDGGTAPGRLEIFRDFVLAGNEAREATEDLEARLPLASVQLDEGLAAGAWYRLRFSAVGSTLTAELFRADGIRIGETSALDSTYDRGSVAIRSRITFQNRQTLFSGLVVTGTMAEEITPPPSAVATVEILPLNPLGQFGLRVVGPPLSLLQIQVSSNLEDWTFLTDNFTDGDGIYDFVDTDSSGLDRRFYRVVFVD